MLVRPYAPFIPTIVKKIYDSLELEDLVIDMDLDHHSKRKQETGPSKKRKVNQMSDSSTSDYLITVLDMDAPR